LKLYIIYYVNDKIESYFNKEINLYYYKNNKDLLFIRYKNMLSYNNNKNIYYKNICRKSYKIEYKDKNNKIINLNNNRTKNKKFNNNIWYLIQLSIYNNNYPYSFILYKYYIFNNYYIYCLKRDYNNYNCYEKIKNYYIYNKYLFIIFI